MRTYLTIILTAICLGAFWQSSFDSLIKNVKIASLPYSTEQNLNRTYREGQKSLHSEDSVFIIEKLNSILPTTINPYGGNSFGPLDCADISDCLHIEDISKIEVLCLVKVVDNYLLHIALKEKDGLSRGILICITSGGEINGWMFSDGSANGGNPNGNISRDLTILEDKTIQINEVSWGDNTETYTLNATFIITDGIFELKKRKMLNP